MDKRVFERKIYDEILEWKENRSVKSSVRDFLTLLSFFWYNKR